MTKYYTLITLITLIKTFNETKFFNSNYDFINSIGNLNTLYNSIREIDDSFADSINNFYFDIDLEFANNQYF